MVSMIAPLCLSAEVEVGPATPPEVRMKAWEHHVKLRESSIFKDVEWTAVGPRIQGGKIESIWSVKKRKSTLYAGAGSGNLWKSVNNGTTWETGLRKRIDLLRFSRHGIRRRSQSGLGWHGRTSHGP